MVKQEQRTTTPASVNAAGDLYFSDNSNTVPVVIAKSGIIETILGNANNTSNFADVMALLLAGTAGLVACGGGSSSASSSGNAVAGTYNTIFNRWFGCKVENTFGLQLRTTRP